MGIYSSVCWFACCSVVFELVTNKLSKQNAICIPSTHENTAVQKSNRMIDIGFDGNSSMVLIKVLLSMERNCICKALR